MYASRAEAHGVVADLGDSGLERGGQDAAERVTAALHKLALPEVLAVRIAADRLRQAGRSAGAAQVRVLAPEAETPTGAASGWGYFVVAPGGAGSTHNRIDVFVYRDTQ